MQFLKKSIPTQWKVIRNPRGRGVLKVKVLEAKYEAKLEFLGGTEGAKQKTFCGGSMDVFWNSCKAYHFVVKVIRISEMTTKG